MVDTTINRIVSEALALRLSHPHAPAADVLDLVIKERGVWLEDFSITWCRRHPSRCSSLRRWAIACRRASGARRPGPASTSEFET
jgi:hypothetical protein